MQIIMLLTPIHCFIPWDVHVNILASFVLHGASWVLLLWKNEIQYCQDLQFSAVVRGKITGPGRLHSENLSPPSLASMTMVSTTAALLPLEKKSRVAFRESFETRRPTLFLFLLFFKSWAESFRNWSSSSPLRINYKMIYRVLFNEVLCWTVCPCGLHT